MSGATTGGLLTVETAVEEALSGDGPAADPASARRPAGAFDLTSREREVAHLAAQGLSNRRIAEVLVIAEKTAANHLQNALHSRAQLAARAVELGLVPGRST